MARIGFRCYTAILKKMVLFDATIPPKEPYSLFQITEKLILFLSPNQVFIHHMHRFCNTSTLYILPRTGERVRELRSQADGDFFGNLIWKTGWHRPELS